MKLKVFFASDGDCLLLTSSDGRNALIDGGRSGTFQKVAWPVVQSLPAIDLVVVSHIDADHISGVLWLMGVVADWAVYDYQTTTGRNPTFPKPTTPRPPAIKRFWHNSWHAQLQDLAAPIEEFIGQVGEGAATFDLATTPAPAADAILALRDLGESIPDGVELLRVVENDTPIPLNGKPFGKLVMLHRPPRSVKLGRTKLTVIGPGKAHLEALREEWRDWLATVKPDGTGPEQVVGSLVQAAQIIEKTDPADVTPPNHASITLLAEERGRTCLLTGDAADDEILDGLRAAGRIKNGRFDCNVLKVQHHGAEHNLDEEFASTVLADHYVLCADGANTNPEPDVIKTIADCRAARDPERPFTFWFNTTPARTLESRRKALGDAIAEARAAARRHPGITVNVLDRSAPFFELQI